MKNETISPKRDRVTSTSISFKNEDADSDGDEIQMTLAPCMQAYLAQNSSNNNSCGCLPVPFERAARHSWFRPCFDSDILEGQFKTSSFRQFTKRFRYALIYVMIVSITWLIYFMCQSDLDSVKYELVIFAVMFLIGSVILAVTYLSAYRAHSSAIAAGTALFLVVTSLCFTTSGGATTVSHYTMLCYVILNIYTVFPLMPYISLIICVIFSILTEIIVMSMQQNITTFNHGFIIRILCHICVHVVGFHILVMTHVRVRGTFMKVGQRLLVQRQLEMEKQLKEKMIHSVMPPKVAEWLLSQETGENGSINRSNNSDFKSLFRPFNMSRMDNVSILFADIVGFTKMSSNKTAEEIVDILSDLFERFDELCLSNGCEKISTLGDCYYCVSGCPEPQPDHAQCCVEMGLGMIDAIQEFDVERGEDVNMRVGVHTGTVLCGIVGTRRCKFDVWSNDVTFANKLESTGLPGRVHVSEQTAKFLQDKYNLESYEDLHGVKTYLVEERKRTAVKIPTTVTTFAFDRSSFSKEPRRLRLYSCNTPTKKPHYLSLITEAKSKFASLPNVLGSSGGLSDSADRINSSKWFSYSRLKKDSKNEVTELATSGKLLDGTNLETRSLGKNSMSRLDIPRRNDTHNEEELSMCHSVNSRKDSGIRSTSRRSSIQHQIYLMNGIAQGESLTHRVSGYYTSSQSSVARSDSDYETERKRMDTFDPYLCSLRKQSDLQLIRCVQDISQNSYFVKVPLHQLTLFFKNKRTEDEYRANSHNLNEKKCDSGPITLSTSRFNTYFDILVSAFVLLCTIIALHVLYVPSIIFVVVSAISLFIESTALLLFLIHLTRKENKETNNSPGRKIINLFSRWYPWHVFGGILVSLPIIMILINFSCHSTTPVDVAGFVNHENFTFLTSEEMKKSVPNIELRDHYYILLVLVGLIHFCNFAQLNFFMKSLLALIGGIVFVAIVSNGNCLNHNNNYLTAVFVGSFVGENFFLDGTGSREVYLNCKSNETLSRLGRFDARIFHDSGLEFLNGFDSNETCRFSSTETGFEFVSRLNRVRENSSSILSIIGSEIAVYDPWETILNIFVVLFLVILLNREFEISYRLSYYCNIESNKDKTRVQSMKNQADLLLENIIPRHVSAELKDRAKYCKTHKNVGIIFASIVNFNKLYDETFLGGKEYLRVLNELISDFDELLNSDSFKNVDKIKTIGSTFMAASGLNSDLKKQNKSEYDHIFELLDFAVEMFRAISVFNRNLLGFKLILRVGFNIGEVTAGVIGSSKLFYDIWGDAVNVASRMDSTGVEGRVQFPYPCLNILKQKSEYKSELRGSVYVKGKGDILVYLLKQK